MTTQEQQETTFYAGDGDLEFLGFAACLAARYEARRKSGVTRGLEGFARDDQHAMAILLAGVARGMDVPLNDVPELQVGVTVGRK
ncbi:MAG: hypothetical protein ACREM1_06705 [Longimicrobiales bacterium]